MALAQPSAISHWSAMHYHGLTDQIPRQVFVLTPAGVSIPRGRGRKRSGSPGEFTVAGTPYQFVQTKPDWFFGIEQGWMGEARSLHAFETRGDSLDVSRVVAYALRLDVATAKRLGWVLDPLHGHTMAEDDWLTTAMAS